MLKVFVILQIAALHLVERARKHSRSERGSVTTEHVLWAVAVIANVEAPRSAAVFSAPLANDEIPALFMVFSPAPLANARQCLARAR